MEHTSKRLQALVLVLAMCVSFLQIPSFATAHSGDPTARSAAIEADGSFTITKSCDAHPNASEETVSGKIIEKKVATGTSYVAVDKDGKDLSGNIAVSAEVQPVKCAQDATITYYITVDGKTFYSDKFVTAKATGKHVAVTAEDEAKSYAVLAQDTKNFKEVSNTATCKAKGLATFAKYCDGCGKFVETFTVKSPIVDHQFIKDEKGNPKEFEEVIEAATCSKPGEAYHYIQCNDCGQKLYASGTMFTETAIVRATKFPIAPLPHTFEYTIKTNNPNGNFVTDATNATSLMSAFTVEGKCSVCNHTYKPTIVSVKEDTTKLVKADKCKAGSRTFTIVYNAIDYTKEKDKNGDWQTKEVTEEVTVPYYTNNNYAEDSAHDFGTPVTDNETIVKATCTKDGHYDMVKICKVCGKKEVVSTHTLFATGKHTAAAAKKENVVAATTKKGGSYDLVVRCADCGEIISSTHKTTAKIVVKASKINSVKNYKGKKAKITVKKAASVTGYQIQYGTKKNFKGAKSVKTKATTKTVSKLAKKKYYVRVRTYKVVSGKTYYSSWSGAKTVTIKK